MIKSGCAPGFTIDEVAERLEWSAAKISRIENARVSVLPRDVKFLLGVYGLSERDQGWDVMLALARESRQKGWWHQYGEAVPDWFEIYVGLEAEAAAISAYDAEFVPGLLQTEEYARAVHRARLLRANEEEIEQRVRMRMARQELLTSDDAPQVWLVLNEAVIRRLVSSRPCPATAARQASSSAAKTAKSACAVCGLHLVQCRVLRRLAHVHTGDVLAGEAAPEPGALGLGHVAYQAEQRQVGRGHRPRGELVGRQARTLAQQRGPVPLQEAVQGGALAGGDGLVGPCDVRCCPVHPLMMPCSGGRPLRQPSRMSVAVDH